MKTKNLVCAETDKTDKFENEIKKHAEHAARITMAGENTGQPRRVKSNLKTIDNDIPILHGTSKDHKIVEDEKEGPEVRPIMGAVVGPNVGLSNFIGKEIIRRVAEDAGNKTVCKSTEELISVFESYNKDRVKNGFDKKNI